jgi:hypothetical protein
MTNITTTTTTTTQWSPKKIRNGFIASRKIITLLLIFKQLFEFMHVTEAFQQLYRHKQIIILPSSKFTGDCCHNIPRRRTRTTKYKCKSSLMTMRDRSASYWFTKGDKVKVIEDVFMNNNQQKTNLRNKEGIVVETWEKCNVDPTCCCAEQVDTNYAVRVLFNNNTNDANNATTTAQNKNDDDDDDEKSTALASASTSTSSLFYYYFAEDELIKAL